MEAWKAGFDELKAAYKSWNETRGGSIATWMAFFADEIDLRSLSAGRPGLEWTKSRLSREGVAAYLEGLTSQFAMIHYTVERYVCQDDTIIALCRTAWRNNATGREADTPKVDVWRVRDGKAFAYHEYYDTFLLHQATVPLA